MAPHSSAVKTLPVLLLLAAAAAPCSAAGEVAPVATHVVTTGARTLRRCPLKRVITSPEGWARVTDGLDGAPPAPDFDAHVAVLVVADDTGGASSRLGGVRLRDDGALEVELLREEPGRLTPGAEPLLRCFFLVVPPFPGGVHLAHRTLIAVDGSGSITLASPASPDDRDLAKLPALGPDLRLTYAMADGSPAPAGVQLRVETRFSRDDLTGRSVDTPFPPEGVTDVLPRFRDGVRYTFWAHAPGLRSRRSLVLDRPPPDGPDGNPRPVTYRFLLEPVPGGRR
ncbi:MAG: hypothetical protein KIT58_02440 [Planctomycetota bacterium]|nr:hypothetical protein [Planctomycetota bacterium]